MSIKYDSRRQALAERIKRATNNATYVIPDLQRPYVWTPRACRQAEIPLTALYRFPEPALTDLLAQKMRTYHGSIPRNSGFRLPDR
jgi:hypothetical protein